jgi:hypothetical protein
MRPLIRIAFTLLFLCLAIMDVIGGSGSSKPVSPSVFQIHNLVTLDSFLTVRVTPTEVKKMSDVSPAKESNSAGRICSCQILNLESSNYDHRYVVLLAEKTNDGSGTAFVLARNRLQKEKRHLKQLFYDKIKVVSEMQGAGSCKSMFYQLRTADSHLQLYEILNADIIH